METDYTGLMFLFLVLALVMMVVVKTLSAKQDNENVTKPNKHARTDKTDKTEDNKPVEIVTQSNNNPDWITLVAKEAYHVLIVGETGSGKSTFARALLVLRARLGKVLVLDPHAAPDSWSVPAIGAGRNYTAINTCMRDVLTEMDNRYKMRNNGHKAFEMLTVFVDEFPAIVNAQDCNYAKQFLTAIPREGRKVNINLVILSQSDRVKSLGIEGEGDIRDSFCFVYLGQKAHAVLPNHFSHNEKATVAKKGDLILPIDYKLVNELQARPVDKSSLWRIIEKKTTVDEVLNTFVPLPVPLAPITYFEPETVTERRNGTERNAGTLDGTREIMIKAALICGQSKRGIVKLLRGDNEANLALINKLESELNA